MMKLKRMYQKGDN